MQVVECRDCVAAWQWPQLWNAQESIAFFEHEYGEQSGYYAPEYKAKVCDLRLNFLRTLRPPGRLLDLGAGAGEFVRTAARAGWNALGLDVAGMDADYPDGAQVRRGTIDRVPRDERFDVITMWDVVEHLPEPTSVLAEARDRLANHGVLVLETGNYHSADRIQGGPKWWCFHFDHKWYFTPDVLVKELRSLGFTSFAHADRVFDPEWHGSADCGRPSLLPYLKRSIKRPHKMIAVWSEYRELSRLTTDTPYAGLGIFAVAAWR